MAAVQVPGPKGAVDGAMRTAILSVLEEMCADMTLRDARDWYFDAVFGAALDVPGVGRR